MTGILCDRCRKPIADSVDWDKGAGNCTLCGDDLCASCAGGFDEDGYCSLCHQDAIHGKHQEGDQYRAVDIDTTIARAQAHYVALLMAASETLDNLKDFRNEPFRDAYGILTAIIENLENRMDEEKELLW
jgi:hypothetical protein